MQRCEICGRTEAELYLCRFCGRTICSKHFYEKHICISCIETLCKICKNALSIGYCTVCGKLVCENCSFKTGLKLICEDCYRANVTV